MTTDELIDLMRDGESAAMRVSALLFLIEEAAWALVNRTAVGHTCTSADNDRATALHAAAEMARRDFENVQAATAEGLFKFEQINKREGEAKK